MTGLKLSTQIRGEPVTLQQQPIANYAHQMKLNGKAPDTIATAKRTLKFLSKRCVITNPYEVREILHNLKWKNSTKNLAANIYTKYLKYLNKTWDKPKYAKQESTPFIPTEKELDTLIA